MAVAYRSSTSLSYAGRTDSVLTAPTGLANGDIMLLFMSIGATGTVPTPTQPTGFTLLTGFPISVTSGGFTLKSYCWYKVAASESGSYTTSHATASTECYLAAISGGDTTSAPTATTNNGTGTTTTALSITATNAGAYIQFVSQDWGDTANVLTQPSGSTPTFTQHFRGSIIVAADGILASSGATGNKTITNNSATPDPWTGYLLKIEPPSAGGGSGPSKTLMLLGCGG